MIFITCQTGDIIEIDAPMLRGATLDGMNLHRAVLEHLDMTGTSFVDADMRGALLTRSILKYANFERARLMNAVLDMANLEQAVLVEAKLIAAGLSEANLRGANLRGADVGFASFRGADIRGANMNCIRIAEADLEGVLVDEETVFPDGFVPRIGPGQK